MPPVVVLERPPELCNDPPMNEILLHDTSVFPADFYLQVRRQPPLPTRRPAPLTPALRLQTHSTNPFLKAETVNAAIEDFLGQYPHFCDSLFSVTQRQASLPPRPATSRCALTRRAAACRRDSTTSWGAPSITTRIC